MHRLTILGSTGSIGASTLKVIAEHRERFQVFALSANTSIRELAAQCRQFCPRYAVVGSEASATELRTLVGGEIEVLAGVEALRQIASDPEVDTVVAAIVGGAGLRPTMAAVDAGKKVLLANKESLVMSGALFKQAVKKAEALLLPVDSEHNAIFQCLPSGGVSLDEAGVEKILLTGSGGPFLKTPLEELADVTPERAVAHPNWSMGPKISVDSATMMNKGLEFIEACWLFDARPDQVEIVIHPQSVVHSMVQYRDGSVLAQLGRPDMRTPIAHCLAWPERIRSGVEPLNFSSLSQLEFSAPDFRRFPALSLALEAMRSGGDCAAALNASNEVAVASFLAGRIRFVQINLVLDRVMESWSRSEPLSLDDVIEADLKARSMAEAIVESVTT